MSSYANKISCFVFALYFIGISYLPNGNSDSKAYLFFFGSVFFLLLFVRNIESLYLPAVSWWWFAMAAIFLLYAGFSADPSSALIHLAGFLAAGAFLVVVWQKVLTDKNFLYSSMAVLSVIALLFALFGLYQYHIFLLHGFNPAMLIPSFLPPTDSRVGGPFGQPNFQATVMLIGLCSVSYAYMVRRQSLTLFERTGLGLVCLLLLVIFFLTNSRAGYLSLVCSFVLLYVYSRYRYRLKRDYLFSIKEVVIVVFLFVFSWGVYWSLINLIAPALGSTTVTQEVMRGGSIYNRLNMWLAALLMTADYPVFGVGLDNFKTHLAEYQIKANNLARFDFEDLIYTYWTHNEYLQVLAEGGIAGFIAMTGFLVTAGRGIWRNLKSTATPYIVFVPLALVPLLVHAGFEFPLRFAPLLATFLLLIALSLPVSDRGYNFSIASPLRKGVLSLVCLIFIGLGAWALYWDMEAGVFRRHLSDDRLVDYNLQRLERLADNPVAALTVLRRGMPHYINFAVREQDVDVANYLLPIYQRIIHLEGAAWQWFNLGLLQFTAGYLDDARGSIEKAIYLNPIYEPSWKLLRHLNGLNAVEQSESLPQLETLQAPHDLLNPVE